MMHYTKQDLLDMYTTKVEEHWYTLFNPMLRYLGDLSGKKILDIGCGSGEFTDALAQTAQDVTGIDLSREWITRCNETYRRNNLRFLETSATNLKQFKDRTFDIVIMNMVLLNVPKKKDVEKILGEIARVTKKKGIFLFSDLHPVCMMTQEEGNRKQSYAKNFSYFKNGAEYSTTVTLPNNKKITFVDNHWTFEFYTQTLSQNNFSIERILESNYPKNAPKKFYRYPFPEYITFCCKKR